MEQSSQELNADHLLHRILRILLMYLDLITNKFEGMFTKVPMLMEDIER